jgi:hypothetical protein
MRGFSVVHRAHGSRAGEESSSVSQGNSSKKRERTGATKEAGQPNGGDEEAHPESPATANKKRRPEELRYFACPFYKMDPVRHRSCSTFRLTRISRVKQHLVRKHQRPIKCPRCMKTFTGEKAEDQRTRHLRIEACDLVEEQEPEGISEEKKLLLQRKAPSNWTEKQQWYGVFDTLFPNHQPRPESPYIHPDFVDAVWEFRDYLIQYGAPMMTNLLTASGLIILPHVEGDVNSFLHGVFENCVKRISDRWMNYRDLTASDAAYLDATSGTLSENGQPTPAGNSMVDAEDQSEVQQRLFSDFGENLQLRGAFDGGANAFNLPFANTTSTLSTGIEALDNIVASEVEVMSGLFTNGESFEALGSGW